jgi:hypothetical protein
MMGMFKQKPGTDGDNEAFVHLVRAAQDDREFRETVCAVLRQPGFQRKSILNSMARRMAAAGVQEDVIRAVSSLTDDAVAEKVLALLEKENGAGQQAL